MAAGGLYLDSQILDTDDANAMIKNELSVENHETFMAEISAVNSLYNIHIPAAQIKTKQRNRIILDSAIFVHVAIASLINTQEIMISGTTVRSVLTTLKAIRLPPVSSRSI